MLLQFMHDGNPSIVNTAYPPGDPRGEAPAVCIAQSAGLGVISVSYI